MRILKRSLATALAVAAVASTATMATATTASAASYRCKTSTKSIDDPAYHGPWADDWDFKVSLCAKRSGTTVSTYAKVTWDGPVYGNVDDTSIFDGAYFKLQVKKSQAGTDPVKRSKNHPGIEARLEDSNAYGNYNGSYTTPVLRHKIGSKALADGELHLDWNNDGRGYWKHLFTASPVV